MWECGLIIPNIAVFVDISEIFQVSIEALLSFEKYFYVFDSDCLSIRFLLADFDDNFII